jgi:alkylhydroperoxidase family enzyme
MGRRGRQRGKAAGGPSAAAVPTHMARVRVSDEVWADFCAAAGHRSISLRLSELVEQDVREYRRRQVAAGTVDDRELLATLERARVLHADLTAVVGRLERRLDRLAAPPTDVYK